MGAVTAKKSGSLLAGLLMLSSKVTLAASLQAGDPSSVSQTLFNLEEYRALATVTLGPDFIQRGQSQTLTLLPPFQNHYTTDSPTEVVFDGGLFLGAERALTSRFSAQLGIAGYGDTAFSSRGDVWQFALPKFNDRSYTYQVQHSRVMLAAKVLGALPQHEAVRPYVSLELGAAFNRASAYQERDLVPGALPMSIFSNHSQTSFSYGVGLGVDYTINPHIRLGIGYQFSDLGSAALGLTAAETTTETLGMSHLYTNQLRFQLTYLV